MSFLGDLFSLIGGSSAKTDRAHTLRGWGGLESLMGLIDKGQQNTDKGLQFYQDIMSGDPNKTAAAIAPEIRTIQGQAEQQKKHNAEFGTRSGGTAASNANIDTNARSSIQNLVNTLRPEAAKVLTEAGLQEATLGGTAASTLSGQSILSRPTSFDIHTTRANQLANLIADLLGLIPTSGGGGGGGGGFGGADPLV